MRRFETCFAVWAVLCLTPCLAQASEADAVAISANIRRVHMPFGTILDPIYSSPTSNEIAGYTRCGDSALWTGAYLAAESFRYQVTQSAEALSNVRAALSGLKALVDVTGDNRLARCIVAADSPFAAGIAQEEAHNAIHQNAPYFWADNTSRDEVVGAFFGLSAAYDFVDDPSVQSSVRDVTARLIGFVSRHQWSPNDDALNTFLVRPEELLGLLKLAAHVNPSVTVNPPSLLPPVDAGALFDVQSISSYFKFNLDYMSFYHLVRLQNNSSNVGAYRVVRNYTVTHQNAFFNMVDRALGGADAARDAETRSLLEQWLLRPKRDAFVDLSGTIQVCGSEACAPVPVALRPPTDFLWQRDPFQLSGGGSGVIEAAGIDYILPYWMARYYGVISGASVQSAAAVSGAVAPNSIASLYGTGLALSTAQASAQPLPAALGGLTLVVTDAAGIPRSAPLIYVSPTQINFVVPDGTAPGAAQFAVSGGPAAQTVTGTVDTVAPTLFSMNGTGTGVAAATALFTQEGNPQLQSPVPVFRCMETGCVSVPINLGVDTPIYATFYGTGFRNRGIVADISVTIHGIEVPVLYAGAAPGFAGLDQVNVSLTLGLRGSGESDVVLTDGRTSNTVTINIQ